MSECGGGNDYDGRMGTRISSIFVILVGSFLGTWFPVFAARHKGVGIPAWAFFVAKYFGSGVIVTTAFIHLLAPANEALGSECLSGAITSYPWPEGIALMSVFALFFVELITLRYGKIGEGHAHDTIDLGMHHRHEETPTTDGSKGYSDEPDTEAGDTLQQRPSIIQDPDQMRDEKSRKQAAEEYAAQLTGVFILEFGVIFHSIFIGLTLAVSGSEFIVLYIVLVFHQSFEGLALGTRLASVAWPRSKRWTPYILGAGYALSTPIAIAIGLGIRTTFAPGSRDFLIVNGVFDSLSAGILLYTGLVELMAHDFIFNAHMKEASFIEIMSAFGTMCLGAGLMALLGYWA